MQKIQVPSDQDDDDNPDLRGVHVDGFPLPQIPIISDQKPKRSKQNRVLPLFVNNNDQPSSKNPYRRRSLTTTSSDNAATTTSPLPLRVIVAGGGLGGLAMASALYHLYDDDNDPDTMIDVHVLEKTNAYRPFGGPIQIQSNAL
jgi:hypothetical protein